MALCPFCYAPYHKLEFLEWLKVKANCKVCNKELDLWEFQKTQGKILDEKFLKKCKKCLNNNPNDAMFCVYCGEELI